jgi:hypothetical protein
MHSNSRDPKNSAKVRGQVVTDRLPDFPGNTVFFPMNSLYLLCNIIDLVLKIFRTVEHPLRLRFSTETEQLSFGVHLVTHTRLPCHRP